jgi:large subunit ribosomal protein L17
VVRSREVASKLFEELATRYRERPGGYTRVLKLRTRVGDAAPISLVELVDREGPAAKPAEPPKGKAPRKRAAKAEPEAKPRKGRAAAAKAAPAKRGKAKTG